MRGNRKQHELAAMSGVSLSTITDIERGIGVNPRISTIVALCDACKYDVGTFLSEAFPEDVRFPVEKGQPLRPSAPQPEMVSLELLKMLLDGFVHSPNKRRGLAVALLSPGRSTDFLRAMKVANVDASLETILRVRAILGDVRN